MLLNQDILNTVVMSIKYLFLKKKVINAICMAWHVMDFLISKSRSISWNTEAIKCN